MTIKASATITLSSVVDVQSTTRYYLLQASTLTPPTKPVTNPPGGAWDDTEPSYTTGSTNTLYFTDLTVFSDNTWAYSAVSVSSSYEAAKAAYNKAAAAQGAVTALDNSLTQQEIFNRLTDNGAAQGLVLYNGQLYVNASYINAGYLSAARIKGDILTLGGANNVNGAMQVLDASGNVVVTLNKDGADITEGSLTAYSDDRQTRTYIANGRISFQYYNTLISPPGWVTYAYIVNDQSGQRLLVQGDTVKLTNQSSAADMHRAEIEMVDDSILMTATDGYNGWISLEVADDGIVVTGYNHIGDPRVLFKLVDGQSSNPLSIGNGGTGANNAAQARANLGVTPANIGALAKSGGTMSGDIDMGQSGASSGAPSIKWRTADGTLFSFRPYGNTFQLVRGEGLDASGFLNVNSDGTVSVNPQASWRSALGVVPSILSLTAGTNVSIVWQSNVAVSGVLILNANVTVSSAITGSNKTVANLPSGYRAAAVSNPFLAGRFGGATHQLYIAANGTSIITGFGATNIPAGDYVLSGVIMLG